MSAAQVLPSEDLPIGRGHTIAGKQYGLLTALRVVEKDLRGNRWLLACECGRYATRTVAALNRALAEGHEPMCSVCARELRAGAFIAARQSRSSFWGLAFTEYGTLYGADYDRLFVEACLEEQQLLPAISETASADLGESHRRRPGHGANLYPIRGVAGWQCLHCSKPFTEGFGCVACVEPICAKCVEQHVGSDAAMTLEEVGRFFDLSRERVRQMEARALRKLRLPARAKMLAEFAGRDIKGPPEEKPFAALLAPLHCGQPLTAGWYCGRCGNVFRAPEKGER